MASSVNTPPNYQGSTLYVDNCALTVGPHSRCEFWTYPRLCSGSSVPCNAAPVEPGTALLERSNFFQPAVAHSSTGRLQPADQRFSAAGVNSGYYLKK
jgi:hypothetical protein